MIEPNFRCGTQPRRAFVRRVCAFALAVAWLATQLSSRGSSLKAGQVVMTGSVMKTVFPTEDANYRFELAPIGTVEVLVREDRRAT